MGIPGFNKSGFKLSWNGFDWTKIEVNNFELPTCALCLQSKEIQLGSIYCCECEEDMK
tara:strand:- start:609 stop:782 length:174 start_codon:yes stop_codon:yes gene_type:complete